MGRQSFVHIEVDSAAPAIRVGGAVVPVLEGALTLPDAG